MRLAYSFEDSGQREHIHRGVQEQPGQQELQDVVRQWNDVWSTARPDLRVYDEGQRLQFVDSRPCAQRRRWTAGEWESQVYRLCDSAQTPTALVKHVSALRGAAVSLGEIEPAVESLCRARVLLRVNGKLLGVAVCGNDRAEDQRGGVQDVTHLSFEKSSELYQLR